MKYHFLIVFFFIALKLIKSSHCLYNFFWTVLTLSEYFLCCLWDIILVNYCFFTCLSAEQLLSLHIYMSIVRFRSWDMIFLKMRPILLYLCLLNTSLACKTMFLLLIRSVVILIKRYIIGLWKTSNFFFEVRRRWKALLLSHMSNMRAMSLFWFVSTLNESI